MKRRSLPPGFRFHPTHVELVMFYLKKKVMKKKLPTGVISELDIYKYAPWDLPDKSCLKSGDLKWYFFCPRERKYASGARMNRATEFGYWKSTGKDRTVAYNNEDVGQIKTLTFFRGKAPKGDQTDWVMHEYRIEEKNQSLKNVVQDAYVLCVIFQKDGPGPRNGAQYGAPFKEEDWDDDSLEEVDSLEVDLSLGMLVPPSKELPNSFAPDISTAPSSNFGCSSVSCISENLASTSKEIPQIPSGSIAPVEMPLNLDDVDVFTFDELFPGDNLNMIDADGFQTVAASNNTDQNDAIYEGLEDIGGWSGALNGDGHEVKYRSEQTFPINRGIVSLDPMSYMELNDLDAPLTPTYEDMRMLNFNATYNCYSVIGQSCLPFTSFGAAKDPGHPTDPRYPGAHMPASSQSAWPQGNIHPNSNEGCDVYKAPWSDHDWNNPQGIP